MPYKRRGRTVYVKKGGRWRRKLTARSIGRAKKAVGLLRRLPH